MATPTPATPGTPALVEIPGPTPVGRLMALIQLTDSALPTGAFSHSFGFETYIAAGDVTDADTFGAWLRMFVAEQLTYTDALVIRLTHAATDPGEIDRLDDLVTAQALPRQVREGSATMGRRLLEIGTANYPCEWARRYRDGVVARRLSGHPALALAVLTRDLGIEVDDAVTAHLYSTVISLTQNAVRAIPLGQNAGQHIIAAAQPWVAEAVERSRWLEAEDLGAIAPGLEIAQMRHERQRVRLFMS